MKTEGANRACLQGIGRTGFFVISYAIFSTLFLPITTFASTIISDDISTDTLWTMAQSPYVVQIPFTDAFNYRPLTVPAGVTLTIEPGVVVKFDDYNGMLIRGSLQAVGTDANPIYFTSLADDAVGGDTDATSIVPTDEQWMHLQFENGSTGNFDHAVVRYGGQQLIFVPNTGIENRGGIVTLDHTHLSHNGYDGLVVHSGVTHVRNSEFDNHVVGIRHDYPGGTLSIDASDIHDNTSSGLWQLFGTTAITGSDIHDNGTGIQSDNAAELSVHESRLYGNGVGIENGSDATNIDATSNWWGSSTGPSHASNPGGAGDAVSDYVTFLPWLTSDPSASACSTNCNSNVLFLPGLEASRLYRPDYNGGTDKLWEPYGDNSAMDLNMNPDGTAVREDVYTKDVIDNAYIIPSKGNVYAAFISSMNDMKSAGIINDWAPAPYDWRLSLDEILNNGKEYPDGRIYYAGPLAATSTPFVIQELRRLAATSRTGKVTIVAHSNGGLVAKALTDKLGTEAAALIDKIIFVAVPQAGTPKAIGGLLHGFEQELPVSWFPLALSNNAARELAQNMSSIYNLLPSADYFTYVDDPVITFDDDPLLQNWRAKYGVEIHSGERLHQFLADSTRESLPVTADIKNPMIVNDMLLTQSETVHAALDAWTPPAGIALTEIAGWGEETLKTIVYYQGVKGECTARRADSTCATIVTSPVLEYSPKTVLDGDGTVVVPSALWTPGAAKYWVDLLGYGNELGGARINRKHADILEVPELRTFIENIITANITTPLPLYISSTTPTTETTGARLHFTLHSPLSLDLYDGLGNHTGVSTTTGFLEENIPGSRYEMFGELKYVSTPASTTLRLLMKGLAEGSFTLDAEEVHGDTVTASTTFAGIPSSVTTTATLSIPGNSGIASTSPLVVDENSDGAPDIILIPKHGLVVVPDITAPEVILSFGTTTDDLALFGGDDLSSVSVIPQSSPSFTTLSYTLTDEAGNTTTLSFKKIKDKEHANSREGSIEAKLSMIEYRTPSTTTRSTFPENEVEYAWEKDKKGAFKEFEQKFKVNTDFTVRAAYDGKKNETKIFVKNKGSEEKLKEKKSGLVILRLVTKQGKLDFEY